jgi:hypothetical protein
MSITTRYREEIMVTEKRAVFLTVEQIDMLMRIVGPIMDDNADRWSDLTEEQRRRSDMLADVENILWEAGSRMEDN